LVNGADAKKLSTEILTSHSVLPDIAAPFRLKPLKTTGAVTAYSPKDGARRQVIKEDTTVLAEVEVDVRGYGLKRKALPVVGGGGLGGVLGERGAPVAVRGVWRPAVRKPELYEVIPQSKADETYRALIGKTPVVKFTSELAYYSAPPFSEQDLFYPVYVYSGI